MQEKPTWLQLFKNRPIDSITPPKMAKKQKLTTTYHSPLSLEITMRKILFKKYCAGGMPFKDL